MRNARQIITMAGWLTALVAMMAGAGAMDQGTAPEATVLKLALIALVSGTAGTLAHLVRPER